jgi:hypothetical protein
MIYHKNLKFKEKNRFIPLPLYPFLKADPLLPPRLPDIEDPVSEPCQNNSLPVEIRVVAYGFYLG